MVSSPCYKIHPVMCTHAWPPFQAHLHPYTTYRKALHGLPCIHPSWLKLPCINFSMLPTLVLIHEPPLPFFSTIGLRPGQGTNHNETLHCLLKRMSMNAHYGPELAFSHLAQAFFQRNETIQACPPRVFRNMLQPLCLTAPQRCLAICLRLPPLPLAAK